MSTGLNSFRGIRNTAANRLCDSCRFGLVRRGTSENSEEVFCAVTAGTVRIRVVKCTRHEDTSRPSLYDMRQAAWVLHTDSKRQQIGFIRASEWMRQHENERLFPAHLG